MAISLENPPITPELYLQTLEELALRAVCVDEISATCNRDVLDGGRTTINMASKNFERQTPDEYHVYITYQLTGVQDEVSVLKIEATFCVIFDTTERVPDGFFEVFSENNLVLTTMPYFRELIASVTGRMGLPTLTIPYNIFSGGESTSKGESPEPALPETPAKKTRRKKEQ